MFRYWAYADPLGAIIICLYIITAWFSTGWGLFGLFSPFHIQRFGLNPVRSFSFQRLSFDFEYTSKLKHPIQIFNTAHPARTNQNVDGINCVSGFPETRDLALPEPQRKH